VAISSTQAAYGARLLLSLLATVIIAWLVISWNDDRLQTQGIVLLERQPPQTAEALESFRAAKLLNASLQPDAFEASVLFLDGDRARAVASLERLLRSEPENRTGWLLLGNWLRGEDPSASARAFQRAAQLDGIKQPSAR
jgi:cytochrome c-type biogenesis protein CcmH/NrfG